MNKFRNKLKKIYLFIKGIEIWNGKMSEELTIRVISVPTKLHICSTSKRCMDSA